MDPADAIQVQRPTEMHHGARADEAGDGQLEMDHSCCEEEGDAEGDGDGDGGEDSDRSAERSLDRERDRVIE